MRDVNGVPLEAGQEVTVKGKVLGLSGEGSRHVIIQTEDQSRITVNTNQVAVVVKKAEAKPAQASDTKVAANTTAPTTPATKTA